MRTRLLPLEPNDALRELTVDVQSLPASDRVLLHDGVDVLNGLATHNPTAVARAQSVGLLVSRVHRLERLGECDKVK